MKGNLGTEACSPLFRLITKAEREKGEPYPEPPENYLLLLCKLILVLENTLVANGLISKLE